MNSMDDDTLMKLLAAGDRQALRSLYERHAEFVYRIAFRFLGHEEDARDISQSVFVNLMQAAHRYRPEAKLSTWIYRIVVNRCLNERARARHRLHVDLSADELARVPDSDEHQPDRLVESSRRQARLLTALQKLPRRQRIALILSRFEGLSYEEIAQLLDCTKSSVESMLFRARRSLAKHFFA